MAKKEKATKEKKAEAVTAQTFDPAVIGTGNIHERLARIMARVGTIPKEGHNAFHNYDYVKEDTLTEMIRPMLAEEGISLIFGAEEVLLSENCIAHVRCKFTLGCSDGNIESTVWGAGRDADRNHNRGDKAVYKAMTGATKYFLYKTFLVSTGDDVEQESNGRPAGDPQITPGQLKELEKFNGSEMIDAECQKWILKMITDGGSQKAAARIIAEAKKQTKAFEEKQKEELAKQDEKAEEDAAPPNKVEPVPDDDDIPF